MALNYQGQPTYFPINQQQYNGALAIVVAAQAAWVQMQQQFAAENVAMGISQAGVAAIVANALEEVNTYGSTGSLWQAYDALSSVQMTPEMAPFLTPDRIQWMRNQMIQVIASLP